jgi:chromosome segregation ATPase
MKLSKKEITEKYESATNELANVVSKIYELRNRFKFLSESAEDNGDPYFTLDEALVKLAAALAEATIYTKEYKEELNKQA